MNSSAPSFLKVAIAAFPANNRAIAADAAEALSPYIASGFGPSSVRAIVRGETVTIPSRIYLLKSVDDDLKAQSFSSPAIQCLLTRSSDGYQRQASLRWVLSVNKPWSIPFVVLLAGEYVVEIALEMVASIPILDQATYVHFVHENRDLMCLLRSKATSYWDCYHRAAYPNRSKYPGLAFLDQLELWAS